MVKNTGGSWQLQVCMKWIVAAALMMAVASANTEQGLQVCCENVSSDPICNDTCFETLSGLSQQSAVLTSTQVQVLSSACSPAYTTFWSCLNESISRVDPNEQMPTPSTLPGFYYCCEESSSSVCRQSCQKILANISTLESAFSSDLTMDCGLPPSDPIWICLLEYEEPTIPTTVDPDVIPDQPPYADWARVQCCYKAVADECRSSCLQLYSGQVSSSTWYTFQLDCIHRPSENVLSTCLSDVSAPCKLGCTGLQFCEKFNNRPTMSFRHCTTSADRMAKTSYYSWIQSGVIPHPLITLFVDEVDHCLSEMWKTVACITHVQPCHATTHVTQICRDDCLKLLSTCSDSNVAPQAVCDIIAPANTQEYCISLSQFLEPSEYEQADIERVTNPCSPNPCAEGYFCAINHRCQAETQSCTPYSCQPGCVVGDRPSFVVSEGGGVRVSLVTSSERSCYGYFNCSSDNSDSESNTAGGDVPALGGTGVSSGYRPVYQHCEEETHCLLNGTTHNHQTTFSDGCNFCTCYHGRVTCTNRSCSDSDVASYLPCDCPMTYQPVCAKDGKTIPNSCFARCLGYEANEIRSGDCGSTDPCGGSSVCQTGTRCLPHRHVCISPWEHSNGLCKQYTCESVTPENCERSDPVCDSNNVQHTSVCSFLTTQGQIDYFGYCNSECSQDSLEYVCGVNGETYNTLCHAENAYVAVDYTGRCRSIPGSNTEQTDVLGNCADVICPPLPSDCVGVLSLDSCCPKCGGHLTILFDEEVLKMNIIALGMNFLSSADILRKLRYHISSLQCDLFGHLSHDGSLSAWVMPTQRFPDNLMVKSCNSEAIKLATFINNQTPMLASDPILSHLVAAKVVTTEFFSSPRTTTPGVVNPRTTTFGKPGGAIRLSSSVTLVTVLTFCLSVFALF